MTLEENAPDSMLAFRVHDYIFVKNTIERGYDIDDQKLVYTWIPFPGIYVKTTIEAVENGHVRTHEITSDVACEAYDCGFAMSTDDRICFERTEQGDWAEVKNEEGFCRVTALKGNGSGKLLIPDPNTNLMHSKTTIPMVVYDIKRGVQIIRTEVAYFD